MARGGNNGGHGTLGNGKKGQRKGERTVEKATMGSSEKWTVGMSKFVGVGSDTGPVTAKEKGDLKKPGIMVSPKEKGEAKWLAIRTGQSPKGLW